MKKLFALFLVAVMICALAACSPQGSDSTETQTPPSQKPASAPPSELEEAVAFTDAVLEELVREAMGKPEGDITTEDAEAVTVLDVSNADWDAMNAKDGGIKDLSGLEYFTNLTELHIDFNNMQDLYPLASLTKLETLTFSGVRANDLSPLKNLTNMVNLTFNWSYAPAQGFDGYKSLDFTAEMKNLERLEAQNAGICDISALSGLIKLWGVYLDQNQITDIAPLANHEKLTELLLSGNPIEDFSPLEGIYPLLQYSDFELS